MWEKAKIKIKTSNHARLNIKHMTKNNNDLKTM